MSDKTRESLLSRIFGCLFFRGKSKREIGESKDYTVYATRVSGTGTQIEKQSNVITLAAPIDAPVITASPAGYNKARLFRWQGNAQHTVQWHLPHYEQRYGYHSQCHTDHRVRCTNPSAENPEHL